MKLRIVIPCGMLCGLLYGMAGSLIKFRDIIKDLQQRVEALEKRP